MNEIVRDYSSFIFGMQNPISNIMKTMILLFALSLCCLGCSTYKNISRRTELSEATIRAKLIPGKKYSIILNSGMELKVRVTHVDSLKVYGTQVFMAQQRTEIPFSESYSNLHQNASRIAVKKFNPLLTAVAVIVPIAAIAGTVTYYSYTLLLYPIM
jgi:hypothetical protein